MCQPCECTFVCMLWKELVSELVLQLDAWLGLFMQEQAPYFGLV